MGGAHGEERCSYRPQQHGCDVNGIWGEAGRSLLLLEASSRMSKQARLSDVPAAGRPPVGSLAQARPCFHKPKEDRQLIGRSRNLKNKSLSSTSNTTTTTTHPYIRNHAARRQEAQDPQDQRESRRLNFIRFRFSPGIPHRLSQAQSAARRTWTRAGAKKGEGGDCASEKRGAHTALLKISDQRNKHTNVTFATR